MENASLLHLLCTVLYPLVFTFQSFTLRPNLNIPFSTNDVLDPLWMLFLVYRLFFYSALTSVWSVLPHYWILQFFPQDKPRLFIIKENDVLYKILKLRYILQYWPLHLVSSPLPKTVLFFLTFLPFLYLLFSLRKSLHSLYFPSS